MLITRTKVIDIKVHAKIAHQRNADCHVQNQSPAQLIHQKLTDLASRNLAKPQPAGKIRLSLNVDTYLEVDGNVDESVDKFVFLTINR